MINEIFNSIHESIKRRNTPDSFIPSDLISKDIIHRGYIKDASFPLKYDFIPDGKGHSNSGSHVYSFRDGDRSGIIEINHRYKPNLSGHETISNISFEMNNGKSPEEIEIHRMILPALQHHIVETLIRKLGSNFESFETKGNQIVKRKIDPRTQRIIGHIRSKINKNKEK